MPPKISTALFGDRAQHGLAVRPDDPHWIEWQTRSLEFYQSTQRSRFGFWINRLGYRVLSTIDLSGKKVLEVGGGDIRHCEFWNGMPQDYTVVDSDCKMLDCASESLQKRGISARRILLPRKWHEMTDLDLPASDVVVMFYCLEHLHPLNMYVEKLAATLSPDGVLVGAVPCEGGIAWGLGRLVTSRRWLRRNTDIDPDKIICWEHPNFVDTIIETLDVYLSREYLSFSPWRIPNLDANLIASFVYSKRRV